MKSRFIAASVLAGAIAGAFLLRKRAAERALLPIIDGKKLPELERAVREAYDSTVAALGTFATFAEHEASDARAFEAATALQAAFEPLRPTLSPALVTAVDTFVESISAERIRLMAFAMNRKNRVADAVQAEAETADRKAFESSARPLLDGLLSG